MRLIVCLITVAIGCAASSAQPMDPPAVSAEALAQAVQDDVNAAAKKYHLTTLDVDGVVTSHMADKKEVFMLRLEVKVKDRKTDKTVDFTIFCGLKEHLPKGDKRLDDIAVGKRITFRGKSGSMGNGQVTFYSCIILPAKEKGPQPKMDMKPG